MLTAARKAVLSKVIVETTTACNIRCVHCAVSNEGYVIRHLSYSSFESLEPLLRTHRPEVVLNGHGETLLHRRFFDMLDASLAAGCRVVFQTNATLLTPALSEKLVARAGAHRLFRMTFSLDAAEAQLFERIRAGASFPEYVANIQALQRAKASAGQRFPDIGFQFTSMRMNVHQLPATVALVKELGGTDLTVGDLKEYPTVVGESVMRDLPYAKPFFEEAARLAKEIGVAFYPFPSLVQAMPTLGEQAAGQSPSLPEPEKGVLVKDCEDPWTFAFLQPDGAVRPCCFSDRIMGNLNETRFSELWESAGYQAFRDAVASPSPPPECLSCRARGWKRAPASESPTGLSSAFSRVFRRLQGREAR